MSDGLPQREGAQRRRRRHVVGHNNGSAGNTTDAGRVSSGRAAAEQPLEMVPHRSAAEEGYCFEYLDHPADVQIHAWGSTLTEAFEGAALAMYNYMTPLSGVSVNPQLAREFQVEAHDLQSLLFSFLDELLFVFSTDMLVCKSVRITTLDQEAWTLHAKGEGEHFDRHRHAIGTEIKAITYSAMQIHEKPNDAEVFVIVDI